MRRFLSLALLALFCLFANVAFASVTEGDVTYTTSGSTATVSSVSTSATGDLVIPETISDGAYTVTAVAEKAFYKCTGITTLTLPSTITSMGSTAIYGCTALTDIYCYAETVPECSGWLFSNMSSVSLNLWVPCGCKEAYENYTYKISSVAQNVWAPTSGPAVTVGEMACASDEEAVDIDYDNCSPEVNNEDAFELNKGEDATFTIAFTGAVKLDADNCYVNEGNGTHGSITLEGVSGTEDTDNEGYYTQWTITVSSDIIDTYGPEISIVIAGTDSNGNTLYADDGEYTTITYYYTLVSNEAVEILFDPESGSTVTELGKIKIYSTQGSVTYESYDSEIPVYKDGVELSDNDYFAWNDEDEDKDGYLIIVVNDGSWSADEGHITEPGTYTITFTAGMLAVGGIATTEDITVTYIIEGESNEESSEGTTTSDGIEITPAAGTVTSISSIRFAHDPIIITWDYNESNVQIVDANGNVVAKGYTDGYEEEYEGWNDDTAVTFSLDTEVTAAGTYTLKVPAGFFYLDSNYSTASAAIEVEYTIEGSDDSTGDEEVTAYGTSLGEMEVGTEDDKATYTASDTETSASYYVTYTPDADGTLYITSGTDYVVYSDAEGDNSLNGSWSGTTANYTLAAGTTYYIVFTTSKYDSSVNYTAWYVEMDTSVSYDFSVVSVTAADGTDLTSNITTEGKLDLAVLEDGMQMVINCTNASGYYLDIVFGTVGTEQYLTETSDRLTADENGNFTWTGGWDYSLVTGYTYPVVCTLYDAQHQGNVVAQATVLTLVGTSENTVSDVTLVSSDPAYNSSEDIEVSEGDDLVITLTFSDYVNITASINQGLYGSVTLTAEGTGTGDGNGNYTTWTVTIPASQLADDSYGGEITISISGKDANGKSLFDESGYSTFTYNYTIVSSEAEEVSVAFDPESGSTVDSLNTITVTGVVEDGTCTSLEYVSYDSSFPIYVDGSLSDYELYNDEDALSSDESDEDTNGNQPRDGEEETASTGAELVFSIVNVSDPYNEIWNTTITDAGTYTVTLPAGTFKVNNTVYDEDITLTYTIESTSNESGEGEGDENGNGSGEGDENGGTETGISAVQAAIADGAEVYTISGQKVTAPVNGVNIVKYADGSVKKILQK
ncbi:MAG: leucine-rich repeat domain-containing protein [Prevotella sp.]|nr:leucine-rich repeat domain-containing protein [Prevotella sp.]